MIDEVIDSFRNRMERIRTELEAADPAAVADRSRLGEEILSLFRDLERTIAQLNLIKDDLRPQVERFKAMRVTSPSEPPRSQRADHLGSSTFRDRGWSAIAAGDYPAASEALEKALKLAPGDPDAGALLGWSQMAMEEYDNALATLQRVLLRAPDHDLARVNLGYVCLRKGIYGEAIEHLARVMRSGTDRKAVLYAHLYMGRLYVDRDMLDDAKAFFRKAIELGPNLIEAYWELGRACYLSDDKEGAVEIWSRGTAANRFSQWGERCREAVQQLEKGDTVSFA